MGGRTPYVLVVIIRNEQIENKRKEEGSVKWRSEAETSNNWTGEARKDVMRCVGMGDVVV